MLMSWCPTGPKSTYLLFPRPHNGTGCYVNEPVPELIYAMLNFVGVHIHTWSYMYRLVCALKHPCVCMSGLESRPVHPQICLPIYLPTNDPPIFHLISIYCIYLSPGLHIHPSISILNDSHLCPCKRRDCSRFVASSCLTCSESLPCKTSKKKGWPQCNIRKEWVPSLWHWLMHNCVGLLCCSLHIEPAREDPLQPGILKICRGSPQAVAGTRTGTQRVRMSVGCLMFQGDYDWATSPTLLELCSTHPLTVEQSITFANGGLPRFVASSLSYFILFPSNLPAATLTVCTLEPCHWIFRWELCPLM